LIDEKDVGFLIGSEKLAITQETHAKKH
jgi:hypothetical protein